MKNPLVALLWERSEVDARLRSSWPDHTCKDHLVLAAETYLLLTCPELRAAPARSQIEAAALTYATAEWDSPGYDANGSPV